MPDDKAKVDLGRLPTALSLQGAGYEWWALAGEVDVVLIPDDALFPHPPTTQFRTDGWDHLIETPIRRGRFERFMERIPEPGASFIGAVYKVKYTDGEPSRAGWKFLAKFRVTRREAFHVEAIMTERTKGM